MNLPDYKEILNRKDLTPEQRETLERLSEMGLDEQNNVIFGSATEVSKPQRTRDRHEDMNLCPTCSSYYTPGDSPDGFCSELCSDETK